MACGRHQILQMRRNMARRTNIRRHEVLCPASSASSLRPERREPISRPSSRYFAFLVCHGQRLRDPLSDLIMGRVEGQQHSWITGFYWTLVVMTTLGFGDITFTSDIGRLFSIVVLLSGVVFLLVMLPFLFIRLFYAPWLESRVRLRAPREVPRWNAGARDHHRVRRHRRRPGRAAEAAEHSRTSSSSRTPRRRRGSSATSFR